VQREYFKGITGLEHPLLMVNEEMFKAMFLLNENRYFIRQLYRSSTMSTIHNEHVNYTDDNGEPIRRRDTAQYTSRYYTLTKMTGASAFIHLDFDETLERIVKILPTNTAMSINKIIKLQQHIQTLSHRWEEFIQYVIEWKDPESTSSAS
jgi:hypothetical protein